MEIKNTEVILNTDFKLFKKEKLVFGQKSEEVKEDIIEEISEKLWNNLLHS